MIDSAGENKTFYDSFLAERMKKNDNGFAGFPEVSGHKLKVAHLWKNRKSDRLRRCQESETFCNPGGTTFGTQGSEIKIPLAFYVLCTVYCCSLNTLFLGWQ